MPYKTFIRCFLWLFLLNCFISPAQAQYFAISGHKKRVKIPFRLARNLVVVQLKINHKGPFNFVMDTGAGIMVITDPTFIDSVCAPTHRTLKLSGCGDGGSLKAVITNTLDIEIPGLTSYDIAAAVLEKDRFQLSNYTGMPIKGLLGYDFFNNLAVKINFSDSTMTVYRPGETRKFARGERIPITVEDHKPYVNAAVYMPDGARLERKLIIDLGAGHPLSLENIANTAEMPQKYIRANLGVGFNGPVDGFMSRISEIKLGKFCFKDPISSFPVDDSLLKKLKMSRDGNLGMGILKRFTIVFDYPGRAIYLRRGQNFDEPFEHDMSGMEYYAAGPGLKRIIISRVEAGSAADAVGLEQDDEIVSINLKPISSMSMEQIDNIFKSQNKRNLLLGIYHDKKVDQVILTLKRRI